jgi:hypothetical protein
MKTATADMVAAILVMAFLIGPQAVFAQCPEIKFYKPVEERPVLLVDSVEGVALYALIEGPPDTGRASDLCIALFTEDGRYVATTRTDTKGRFSFASVTVPMGRYRLIATSKAFKDLNIPIELKQTQEADLEKRNRMLLHMRMKSSRSREYVTLLSAKEYNEREKP